MHNSVVKRTFVVMLSASEEAGSVVSAEVRIDQSPQQFIQM